jgi:hypothetical protein
MKSLTHSTPNHSNPRTAQVLQQHFRHETDNPMLRYRKQRSTAHINMSHRCNNFSRHERETAALRLSDNILNAITASF